MRKNRLSILGLVLIFGSVILTTPAFAQRGRSNPQFEQNSPAIGDLLPDVSVYDSDGNDFPLRQVSGGFSVIVFGCLT